MQRLFPFLVIGLFLATPSLQSQNVTQSADEKELRGIETETAKLEQQNDSALAKFFAKDCIYVGPTRVLSKSEFVENIKHNFVTRENGVNPYTIEKKNVQVRVFGDTAVVTYIKEYRQNPDTTKFFNEDDTDVFTREAGGWRLRFTKVAPVQTQSASN
jgi:ketosteroid isomerase-like protein